MKENSFFIEVGTREENERGLIDAANSTSTMDARQYQRVYIPSMKLWYATKVVRKPGKNIDYEGYQIAYIDFFEDVLATKTTKNMGRYDFTDITNADWLYNSKPGFIMNYLQCLNTFLMKGKKVDSKTDIENISELNKLKKDTLFVPKYLLKGLDYKKTEKNDIVTIRAQRNADELFKDYSYNYKIISNEKLSDNILKMNNNFIT